VSAVGNGASVGASPYVSQAAEDLPRFFFFVVVLFVVFVIVIEFVIFVKVLIIKDFIVILKHEPTEGALDPQSSCRHRDTARGYSARTGFTGGVVWAAAGGVGGVAAVAPGGEEYVVQ
jgi:hypothetical protein